MVVAAVVNQQATDAVVRVEGPACGRVQEGSGFAVDHGLIATNAHVVAGSTEVRVHGEHGQDKPATVVAYDPFRDIALLRVHGLGLPPLAARRAEDRRPRRGLRASRRWRPARSPFDVAERVQAEGKDLFGDKRIVRDVFVLSTSSRTR